MLEPSIPGTPEHMHMHSSPIEKRAKCFVLFYKNYDVFWTKRSEIRTFLNTSRAFFGNPGLWAPHSGNSGIPDFFPDLAHASVYGTYMQRMSLAPVYVNFSSSLFGLWTELTVDRFVFFASRARTAKRHFLGALVDSRGELCLHNTRTQHRFLHHATLWLWCFKEWSVTMIDKLRKKTFTLFCNTIAWNSL